MFNALVELNILDILKTIIQKNKKAKNSALEQDKMLNSLLICSKECIIVWGQWFKQDN